MTDLIEKRMQSFRALNRMCLAGGVVCFGSTYFADMDLAELAMDCGLGVKVYNRSIAGLCVTDAEQALPDAVYALEPSKVFVCIGEEDARIAVDDFVSRYEWVLLNIHRRCRSCRIFIVSVPGTGGRRAELNGRLKKLSEDTGCTYIDIGASRAEESPLRVFNLLKPYMRNFSLGFADAMQSG